MRACRSVSAGQRLCRHARVAEVTEAAGLSWLRVAPGIVEHAPIEDLAHAGAVDDVSFQIDQRARTLLIRKEHVVLALPWMVALHDAGPQVLVFRPAKLHGQARTPILLQPLFLAPPRQMPAARAGIQALRLELGAVAQGALGRGRHAGRRRRATAAGLVRGDGGPSAPPSRWTAPGGTLRGSGRGSSKARGARRFPQPSKQAPASRV